MASASIPAPFNARRVRLHRARAAPGFLASAFLPAHGAEDLAERLEAVNRNFGATLAIGAPALFRAALQQRQALAARIGPVAEMDSALRLTGGAVADSEKLPFAPQNFGLIVSNLVLHWANDLPGALVQARRALKPDGLFLASLFGGRTLQELRACLLQAESDVRGGAGARVAPFADARDMGDLLQRAGFALPVADSDVIVVRYENPMRLFSDLRAMGETSALAGAAPPLTRAVLSRTMALYGERYCDADGRARATFEIVTATGWAPHESQQKPLRPGSAKARLADALGASERSAGERAGKPD
jgi:SAM-dependent methyltransferase